MDGYVRLARGSRWSEAWNCFQGVARNYQEALELGVNIGGELKLGSNNSGGAAALLTATFRVGQRASVSADLMLPLRCEQKL